MGFGPIVNQFSLQKTFGVKTDRKMFSKTVVQKVEEVFFLKVIDFICTWVLICTLYSFAVFKRDKQTISIEKTHSDLNQLTRLKVNVCI